MNAQQREIIKLFTLFMILFGEAISQCPTSKAKFVKHCPQSKEKVKIAEGKWNCEATCNTLKYHCLPDTQMRKLFEVCAEKELIIGRVCAEYNTLGERVQANRHNPKADCSTFSNTCPYSYPSTETYKYQECFLIATNSSVPPISTQKTKEHFDISYLGILSIVPIVALVIIGIIRILRKRGSIQKKEENPANNEEQHPSVTMAKTKSKSQTPSDCITKTNNQENGDILLIPQGTV